MKQQKMVSMGQVVLIAVVASVITSLVVLVFGASLTGNATLYKLNSTTNITSVNTTAPRTLGNGTFNVVTANEFRGKLIDPTATASKKPVSFKFSPIRSENGVNRTTVYFWNGAKWADLATDLRTGDSFTYQNLTFGIVKIDDRTDTIVLNARKMVFITPAQNLFVYNTSRDDAILVQGL